MVYLWHIRRYFNGGLLRNLKPLKGQPRRILVIGTHPDDQKIACGGTMMRMHREGHMIHGLILSQEFELSQTDHPSFVNKPKKLFYGLNEVTYLAIPAAPLTGSLASYRQVIEQTVRSFQPEIILTPSDHDQQPDHQLIHFATMEAGQHVYTILCYESPTVTSDFKSNLFIEIGAYLDEKIDDLRGQTSFSESPVSFEIQKHPDHFDVRAHARTRGKQARTQYAEGFKIRRALMMDGGTF